MRTIFPILLLTSGVAYSNAATPSNLAAPVNQPTVISLNDLAVDPVISIPEVEITRASVAIYDQEKEIKAAIVWDLFPKSFATAIVSDEVDGCGHRHIVGRREAVPTESAYRLTEMDLTIYNLSNENHLGCREGLEFDAVLILKTESHDGISAKSVLRRTAADLIPAADYICRASLETGPSSFEEFEILFTDRVRYDLKPGIPVEIFIRSRFADLTAVVEGPWDDLVMGEIARMRMLDHGSRKLTFQSGSLDLEIGNGGITGELDTLKGRLNLLRRDENISLDVFCLR